MGLALGVLLAAVYTVASLAQLVVGRLIDRYPLKWIYLPVVAGDVTEIPEDVVTRADLPMTGARVLLVVLRFPTVIVWPCRTM